MSLRIVANDATFTKYVGYAVPTPVLDSYAGAAAAWSVRKVRTAHAGACVRVRRSSDNTEQDIGFAGGLLDVSSLLTFVGSGNGYIKTWYDQSGNDRHLTQTTAGKQSRIVSSGVADLLNGRIAPVFDGTDDDYPMTGALLSVASNIQNLYMFAAAKKAGTSAGIIAWFTNNANSTRAILLADETANRYQTGGRRLDSDVNTPVVSTVDHSLAHRQVTGVMRYGAGFSDLYENGVQTKSVALANGAGSTSDTVSGSAYLGSGGTASFWSGNIQEVIIYNTNQSANRAAIETNIMRAMRIV